MNEEVESIRGIGPKTAAALKKRGFFTVRDLIYYFPRDYENYKTATKIDDIVPGKVIVRGRIRDLRVRYTRRRNFTITEGEVYDDTGAVRVVWYNQPYRAKAFKENQDYYFTGNFDFKFNKYQLTSPAVVASEEVEDDKNRNGFQPIYKASGSYNSLWFKRLFDKMKPDFADIPDLLPSESAPSFIKKGSRADALYNIHFPETQSDVDSSREYLAYEELFELILAAKLNKQTNSKLKAYKLPFRLDETKKFLSKLPFELTGAQKKATWDILQDLEKPTPMNRLLQGDVGSGKTMVAAIAAYQTACAGFQTALLAPTAILATQHAESLQKILSPLGVKVGLLIGATKHKDELKKHIKAGEVDVIVGTHALLTDDTIFHSLALAVIDEQHRFGVMQRQKLLEKTAQNEISKNEGFAPHFLAMTATPIPRSLQLTVFGDLDVSIINELPKGRQPIETRIENEIHLKENLYPEIKAHLKNGEQVYVICRQIEESAKKPGVSEAANVKKQAEKLKKIFTDYKIESLHGKMKPDEKDDVMSRFAAHEIDILVSTTVVEVGVDVPNATQIVIMDAEHFGLAQLHQLRGRVGRGDKPSNCYLIVTGDNPPSERLREIENSTDGFHLAEVDLRLRGPGEIYGSLQHGALDLRIASLSDTHLISLAQKQAEAFVKSGADVLKYKELAFSIHKYQQLTTLN